jgi:hypothetical protein
LQRRCHAREFSIRRHPGVFCPSDRANHRRNFVYARDSRPIHGGILSPQREKGPDTIAELVSSGKTRMATAAEVNEGSHDGPGRRSVHHPERAGNGCCASATNLKRGGLCGSCRPRFPARNVGVLNGAPTSTAIPFPARTGSREGCSSTQTAASGSSRLRTAMTGLGDRQRRVEQRIPDLEERRSAAGEGERWRLTIRLRVARGGW